MLIHPAIARYNIGQKTQVQATTIIAALNFKRKNYNYCLAYDFLSCLPITVQVLQWRS